MPITSASSLCDLCDLCGKEGKLTVTAEAAEGRRDLDRILSFSPSRYLPIRIKMPAASARIPVTIAGIAT